MNSEAVIQWLDKDGEPVGKAQSYPRRLIKGHATAGQQTHAIYKGNNFPIRIISMGRLADKGSAPSSVPVAGPSKKSKDDDSDEEWLPSESDTDSSEDTQIRPQNQDHNAVAGDEWEEELVGFEPVTSDEESATERGTRWKTKKSAAKAVRKRKRQSGEQYTDTTGKERNARTPRPIDKQQHSHEHTFWCDLFTEEDREQLCDAFWKLGDYKRQKDFILLHTEQKPVKRRREDAACKDAKKISIDYLLSKNGNRYRVCKQFFTSTLDISNNTILGALTKQSDQGHFSGEDDRGRHAPANKMPEKDKEFIRAHIDSFPKIESHYTRRDSRRTYLEHGLSMTKMYELYKERCEQSQRKAYSFSAYKLIFGTEFNIGFHKPKKDQCATCERYKIAEGDEKETLQTQYEDHITRKDACQAAKSAAKETAIADVNAEFSTATFDLQSVLHLPSVDVSPMYYTRKICVYNLTVYDGANKNAHCFTWNEMDGKRGSSEIGSCLMHYIKTLPPSVKHLSLFCDSCGGQNRNQFVMALLLQIVQISDHLETIELNFLEPGHTYMECDSMHSAIEGVKQYSKVYTMNDWENIFKLARRKQPYEVHRLQYSDFFDLKQLAVGMNVKKDVNGSAVNWLRIKSIQVKKQSPNSMFYRYSASGPEYFEIILRQKSKGRPCVVAPLQQLYTSSQPLSEAKKKDLVELCRKGVIPEEYREYYKGLKSSSHCKDVIEFSDESGVEN